jgi:hypothetical protein
MMKSTLIWGVLLVVSSLSNEAWADTKPKKTDKTDGQVSVYFERENGFGCNLFAPSQIKINDKIVATIENNGENATVKTGPGNLVIIVDSPMSVGNSKVTVDAKAGQALKYKISCSVTRNMFPIIGNLVSAAATGDSGTFDIKPME